MLGYSFLLGNDLADELSRRGVLLVPSAIPCSLSSLFLDWRRPVFSKFFDTPVPLISTKELVLVRHVHCVLSRLRCNRHCLLLSSYLSRIDRIENPSCRHLSSHSALSSYGLFALLTLWQLLVSLRPLVQALVSCSASGPRGLLPSTHPLVEVR